jgi:hypothetical protein
VTWFKVDDSFYDHPKVFDAPDSAVALWTRAGAWSARNLTDGFVPTGMPARLCDDHETAVRELLRRGLWKRTGGGYIFHDWGGYQPSREAVEKLRKTRAEAGKRGGQAKAAKQKGKQESGNGLASANGFGKQNAAPTRPSPSSKEKGEGAPASLGGARPPQPNGHNPAWQSLPAYGTPRDPVDAERARRGAAAARELLKQPPQEAS